MIRIKINQAHCCCTNCIWFEDGELRRKGVMIVDEKKYNGEIKKLVECCYLDLITWEKIDDLFPTA